MQSVYAELAAEFFGDEMRAERKKIGWETWKNRWTDPDNFTPLLMVVGGIPFETATHVLENLQAKYSKTGPIPATTNGLAIRDGVRGKYNRYPYKKEPIFPWSYFRFQRNEN